MLSSFLAGGSIGGFSEICLASVLDILFLAVLILAGCQDIRDMRIGDQWPFLLLALGVLKCVFAPGLEIVSHAAGFFCVSIPFFVIALFVPGAIGGGDIKLTTACGMFLGWKAAVVSAAAGIVLGGGWSFWMLASGKIGRKERFPLGPFLCLGMAFGIYGGDPVFHWFFRLS